MLDFSISFSEDQSFTITDNSDYSGYTFDETNLEITYPKIDDNTPTILDLFPENVAAAGDNFTYNIADFSSLSTLNTGVYAFRLVVLNATVEVDSLTLYFINDYQIFLYLNKLIDQNIDDQCSNNWCVISGIDAHLTVAEKHAENGDYNRAEEIIDYLIKLAEKDGCC